MAIELEELLRPLSEVEPCGPELRWEDAFQAVAEAAAAVERPPSKAGDAWARVDWPGQRERILELARKGRDLRVWVWLARSLLASDGPAGLAQGLELIVRGLERFWDILPPVDPEEPRPADRFMARLNALAELGASSAHNMPDAIAARRATAHLVEDLRTGAVRAPAHEAVARVVALLDRLEALVRERFGPGEDPQLGFEVLRSTLAGLARSPPEGPAGGGRTAAAETLPAAVGSRAEVVRALDLVLAYYAGNEPASPVPLLIQRAKRLVNMSFLDAIKELAPAGLKELQAVAGKVDDGKA